MFRSGKKTADSETAEASASAHLLEFTVIQQEDDPSPSLNGNGDADEQEAQDQEESWFKKANFVFQCAVCPDRTFGSVYQLISHKADECPGRN